MESIAIGAREPDGLLAELDAALQPLCAAGARFRLDEFERGEWRFVGCRLEPGGGGGAGTSSAFRGAVARALAAFIAGPGEAQLLRRLAASRYAYFSADERERICAMAARQLDLLAAQVPAPSGRPSPRPRPAAEAPAEPAPPPGRSSTRGGPAGGEQASAHAGGGPGRGAPVRGGPARPPVRPARTAPAPRPTGARTSARTPREAAVRAVRQAPAGGGQPAPAAEESSPAGAWSGPAERRRRILQRVGDYLDGHDTIMVDGFVMFRLKEYVDEVAVAVDRAVDDFLLEREYREFIGLLRYFVEHQTDRPDRADCILTADGRFLLRDEQGRPLGTEFLGDLGPGARFADVGPEDLLVSALITVAPRRVRLHQPEGRSLSADAMASLREVFAGEVEICTGCAQCARSRPG